MHQNQLLSLQLIRISSLKPVEKLHGQNKTGGITMTHHNSFGEKCTNILQSLRQVQSTSENVQVVVNVEATFGVFWSGRLQLAIVTSLTDL